MAKKAFRVFGALWAGAVVLASCATRSPETHEPKALLWELEGPFFVGSPEILRDLTDAQTALMSDLKPSRSFHSANAHGQVKIPDVFSSGSLQESWWAWTAKTTLEVEKETVYELRTQQVQQVQLAQELRRPHSPSSSGFVFLKAGLNRVQLQIQGLRPSAFTFELRPVSAELLVRDEGDEDVRGLPGSKKRVRASWILNASAIDQATDSLSTRYPDRLWTDLPPRLKPFEILRLAYEDQAPPVVMGLHRVGFRSRLDGAPQTFSVLWPKNFDPQKKYAAILALHGARVEAHEHLSTFEAKDWAFVIAPNNRGSLGLGWNDLGRRDALEVLDLCLKHLPIDSEKIYLSGHSMGAQGALHLAIHHPDRFAALSLQAPWIEPDTYVPTNWSLSSLSSGPNLRRLRDRMNGGYRHFHLLKNIRSLPTLISFAQGDSVVSPVQGRFLAMRLKELGAQVELMEHSSSEHFCGRAHPEERFECTDFLYQEEFFKKHSQRKSPQDFEYDFYDSSMLGPVFGFSEIVQSRKQDLSQIKMTCRSGRCSFKTENVESLKWNASTSQNMIWENPSQRETFSKPALTWRSFFAAPFDLLVLNPKAHSLALWIQAAVLHSSGASPRLISWEEFLASDRSALILAESGDPRLSSLLKSLSIDQREAQIGSHSMRLPDAFGALVLQKDFKKPDRHLGFVLSSQSMDVLELRRFQQFWSRGGLGLPDFVFFDQKIGQREWDSFWSAGMFSSQWEVQSRDLYLRN